MNKYIKRIIDNSSIKFTSDEIKILSNIRIDDDKITFEIKTNYTRVFLLSNFLLKTSLIRKVDEAFLENKFKFIILSNEIPTKEIIIDYLLYIKSNIKSDSETKNESYPCNVYFLNENLDIDVENKKIIFKLPSDFFRELFLKSKNFWITRLKRYGIIDFDFEIIIDEKMHNIEKSKIESAKNELKENIKTLEKQSYNDKKNKKNLNNKFNNGMNYKTKFDFETSTFETISEIDDNCNNLIVHGKIIKKEILITKSNNKIYKIMIADDTSAVPCVLFRKGIDDFTILDDFDDSIDFLKENMDNLAKVGDWVSIFGTYSFNDFDKQYNVRIIKIQKISSKDVYRVDNEIEKRIELHTHTIMSSLDGVSKPRDYIDEVNRLGMKAIAFTDHQNVQAFPDIFEYAKKVNKNKNDEEKLKIIYGSEVIGVNSDYKIISNANDKKIEDITFISFDLETTGLSPEYDEIIEFGAQKFKLNSAETTTVDILIKPKCDLSSFTIDLTGITPNMLKDKKTFKESISEILDFIGDSVLIAHNANFDINFLNAKLKELNIPELSNPFIDTLSLCRCIRPKLKNHRLGTIAKEFLINYSDEVAHRGDYDSEILKSTFENIYFKIRNEFNLNLLSDFEKIKDKIDRKIDANIVRAKGSHTNILVKNQAGLKELYKIISYSHTVDINDVPKIDFKKLSEFRKNNNLFIGAGCLNSNIFELAKTGRDSELFKAIEYYDYIEIQPLSVYDNQIQIGLLKPEILKIILRKIIDFSIKQNKIVIATSDAHYTEPKFKIIRDILINTKGLNGKYHPLYDSKGRIKNNPNQHLRTTKEMLDEFAWLNDEKLIKEIVIENPNKIANQIELDVIPLKKGIYPPKIEHVEEKLKSECFNNAYKIYGNPLPKIVLERLERELNSIISNGFSVVYWISHLLVKKSYEDGYLVGSRGSVGSSLVATFAKITEVNPLKAHYICRQCKYSDFDTPKEFKCGYDLPQKKCPKCNKDLFGDGHEIPFETFLGFKGDKVPDIDLNFSGDYQQNAHNFCKEIFGENNCFRAGTISTLAYKSAFKMVREYFEKQNNGNNEEIKLNNAEIEKYALLIDGIKRTTGQHPGGIIVLPKDYDIEDFTPINFPADKIDNSWKTTHFDFHSIHDNLLKLDVLGHVDPQALKHLHDLTKIDPLTIPTNDPKVYEIFTSSKNLNFIIDEYKNIDGAIGLPEFGTNFVRAMLSETKPKNFADLVQVSGLSHGTNVYSQNVDILIKNKIANLSQVIGCRDDIMTFLISKNIPEIESFKIMESIRKGQGLNQKWILLMRENNIPDWYIDSCQKIKYLFPKAHATAYVLMAYRIAWYKIYYPLEYYATWFSTRTDKFDIESIINGFSFCKKKLDEIKEKISKKISTAKEVEIVPFLEVALEMYARGFIIRNIDFNYSDATEFKIVFDSEKNERVIYPPFIAIDSLGEIVANSIVNARNERPITSVEDLRERTQVTNTHVSIFNKLKITDSLCVHDQIKFDF